MDTSTMDKTREALHAVARKNDYCRLRATMQLTFCKSV